MRSAERSPRETDRDEGDGKWRDQVARQNRQQRGVQHGDGNRDAKKEDRARRDGASGERPFLRLMRLAEPRERQRHARRRHQAAEQPGDRISGGAAQSLCDVSDEAHAGEQEHQHPQLAWTDAGTGSERTFREQRQNDDRHHRKPGRREHRRFVEPCDETMQARLLRQEQHGEGRQRCRELQIPESAQHAGAEHDDRRDLRRRVDVRAAGADIAGDDHRDASGEHERRGDRIARFDQQSGDAGQRTQQREGANPAEPRVGPGRVARSLPLDADRSTAKNGDEEADVVRET